MKVVLLYSGGLDSTTLACQLQADGHEVKALSIDYGQRHLKEVETARRLCEKMKVEFKLADLSSLRPFLSGSSQTSSEIEVPEGHYTEESMKLTVVPNRNMLMLSVALAWAVSIKADAVAYAAHAGDHAIYPDCRPDFVEAMKLAAAHCDWHKVQILTPFLHLSKTQIVERGIQLDAPLEQTWSCYKGLDLHCGKCGTCVERKEAFDLLKIPDPTAYQN